MLQIDRLNLRLPPGFEQRAAGIARLIAECFKEIRLTESRDVERITLDAFPISPDATDEEIAERVATEVAARIGETV